MPKGFKGFQKGIRVGKQFQKGKQHPLWKGNAVGYKSLHEWISVNWGKARNYLCICGRQALDWANVKSIYDRNRKNWEPMCRSCHKKFDKSDTSSARKALALKRLLCKNKNGNVGGLQP